MKPESSAHTIYNHASERTAFVCDWFVERLARGVTTCGGGTATR
ncbi:MULTISPECIES: hypothetical protein [unclassified Burkholderia]|nr:MULTISPECIES: hypothetical protein [unclassified Burkholderia]